MNFEVAVKVAARVREAETPRHLHRLIGCCAASTAKLVPNFRNGLCPATHATIETRFATIHHTNTTAIDERIVMVQR